MTTLLESAKQNGTYEENAENDPFAFNPKSSVKIKQTTRGTTWEIKVVSGEEHLLEGLCQCALNQHKIIQAQLNTKKEESNGNNN